MLFVDFILFDKEGEPLPKDYDPNEIITTKVALSKEEQEERIKRVKRAVSERKKLKKEAKESKPKEEKPKETKPKTPKPKAKKETQDEVKLRLAEMRTSEIAKLESWLAQGIIDQPTFVQLLKEIYSKYEKGGLI
jgi:replication initiation and membrane attachment protein DnaB